jgi:hypothetical protein
MITSPTTKLSSPLPPPVCAVSARRTAAFFFAERGPALPSASLASCGAAGEVAGRVGLPVCGGDCTVAAAAAAGREGLAEDAALVEGRWGFSPSPLGGAGFLSCGALPGRAGGEATAAWAAGAGGLEGACFSGESTAAAAEAAGLGGGGTAAAEAAGLGGGGAAAAEAAGLGGGGAAAAEVAGLGGACTAAAEAAGLGGGGAAAAEVAGLGGACTAAAEAAGLGGGGTAAAEAAGLGGTAAAAAGAETAGLGGEGFADTGGGGFKLATIGARGFSAGLGASAVTAAEPSLSGTFAAARAGGLGRAAALGCTALAAGSAGGGAGASRTACKGAGACRIGCNFMRRFGAGGWTTFSAGVGASPEAEGGRGKDRLGGGGRRFVSAGGGAGSSAPALATVGPCCVTSTCGFGAGRGFERPAGLVALTTSDTGAAGLRMRAFASSLLRSAAGEAGSCGGGSSISSYWWEGFRTRELVSPPSRRVDGNE